MADDNNVIQENNVVLGDQVGRDKNVHYHLPLEKPSRMARLVEKFRKERENNKEIQSQIEKLKHFTTAVENEEVKGLEPKLIEGNQAALVDFACQCKELFAKKLAQYQFSEAAQEIHAYLLASVFQRYHLHVYPLVKSNKPAEEISRVIQEHIIRPINETLEDNVLDFYEDEILGMLYFLTGNCHIKWV